MSGGDDNHGDWSPSEELLFFLNRDVNALDSPSAMERMRGIRGVVEHARYEAVPKLKLLLEDDAPTIWDDVIGEVRHAALAALQRLYWITKERLEVGPVMVRRAWPLRDMRRAYEEAMARLSLADRQATLAKVDLHLERCVRPAPAHADDMRAYRALQELGLVRYERQDLDPVTGLTPLQESIYAEQVASPRPRPCLRVSLRDEVDRVIGWVYRSTTNGFWAYDFSEHPAAADARDALSRIMTLGQAGIPRVVHDDQGQPVRSPDGSFVLDGELSPSSGDVVECLRSIAAFMQREFAVELLLPEPQMGNT
jgi:hypothetical protein